MKTFTPLLNEILFRTERSLPYRSLQFVWTRRNTQFVGSARLALVLACNLEPGNQLLTKLRLNLRPSN
jgi:hypothetical protein